MLSNLVILLALVAVILFVGSLTRRAGRIKRAVLKWPAVLLAGLLTLMVALFTLVALVGFYKLYANPGNPVPNLKAAATPEQLAGAERYAHLCMGCHSTTHDLPLDGAADNFFSTRGPLGTLYPANLTPAGPLKDWSDAEIIRAIREGIDNSGQPLVVMPSEIFHHLSDSDVQALVAYLRSQPAVQHDTPDDNLNILGVFIVGAGLLQTSAQSSITQPVTAPPRAVTVEYGQYLVSITGCQSCHGADFAGGTPSKLGPPAGPNLIAIVSQMSPAAFIKEIRTGVDATGHTVDPNEMPYKQISAMYDDDQLEAIFTFLHGLPLVTKK